MRLLILTQYYPPETGAPQNRLSDLALRMQKLGHQVEVLTAMPNYPSMRISDEYRGKWTVSEVLEGIPVHRAYIYASANRSMLSRLMNYFSFVVSGFFRGMGLRGNWDYILCESPPLFLGITAVVLSRFKRARLIFNVSDLWPESAEKLGLVTNRTVLKLTYALEAAIYRSSFMVTGQTQGIVADVLKRFPETKTHWLPNGVDVSSINADQVHAKNWRETHGFSTDEFIILYAGIIGHAQGLEVLLQAASLLVESPVRFVLLGEGPEKESLMQKAKSDQLENVTFLDGVGRTEVRFILAEIDAAAVPLRKLEIFKGAIPSKIFENLAMEKPIFLGVEGEAYELFIKEAKAGWFFEPENPEALAASISEAIADRALCRQLGQNGKRYVQEKFDRSGIAERFDAYLNNFEK